MDVPFLIRGVGVLVFAYAALMDYRYRRVQNHVWLSIATLGATALALELVHDPNRVAIVTGVLVLTTTVTAVAIAGWVHGFVGGADAKAAMVIPVIYPHHPLQPFQSGVFGTLTQGVEVSGWVFAGAAIASFWYTDQDAFPFLVPLFAGILSLFFVSIFVH